jgi:putative ABC transport system permease protein
MHAPTRIRRVARRLLRAPLFTAVAIVTLALGIGANTAIFSVVNGVLLKPLPFHDADRLVGVWHTAPGLGFPLMNQSASTYVTYRDEGRTFEDIALWDNFAVSVTGAGEPERVQALLVTDGFLGILRVTPALGRPFSKEDDSPGSPERVMLSHAYWQRKFGSDPNVVGRGIILDGQPREIIGVLPATFRFLSYSPQLLVPFRINRAELFVGGFSHQGIARLKPGVTIEQANADIARMLPIVAERFPLPPGFTRKMLDDVRLGPNVRPLSADVIGDVGQVLWVLLGTVGIVLLIACANVANLFLVRAEGRQQELAIHAALGASSRRIAWELLSESITLALLGGALGLGLAYAGIRLLVAIAPEGLPRLEEITIDPLVLLFTLVVSLVAGVLFGLIPVFKFTTPHVAGALKEGGRLSSAGRERHRARNALVIVEIGLAVVLLVASGLMIRTFQAMRRVEPGFVRAQEVLTLRVSIPSSVVADAEQTARTHEQIVRRIEQIPGITSVGVSSSITMDGSDHNDPIFVEEFPEAGGKIPPLRRYKFVGGNYAETMGNPVLAGRALTWNDVYKRAPVMVVSENFAREFWKEPSAALGKRIRENPTNPWRTIVGVVGNERDDGVAKPAPSIVYWPMIVEKFWDNQTFIARNMGYAIRTPRLGSPTLLREVQQAVWAVNPNLPVASVRTLEELRMESMAQTSFALVMLGIAASVAFALGVVGIYGVISYIATQRTREIGIRIALGAARGDVSRLFLRHGLMLATAGILVGVLSAAFVTRVMSALLFGVQPLDLVTYAAVAVGLGLTTLLATYLPAMRASRIDPAVALRWEV